MKTTFDFLQFILACVWTWGDYEGAKCINFLIPEWHLIRNLFFRMPECPCWWHRPWCRCQPSYSNNKLVWSEILFLSVIIDETQQYLIYFILFWLAFEHKEIFLNIKILKFIYSWVAFNQESIFPLAAWFFGPTSPRIWAGPGNSELSSWTGFTKRGGGLLRSLIHTHTTLHCQ
jgi:hypothetical protein